MAINSNEQQLANQRILIYSMIYGLLCYVPGIYAAVMANSIILFTNLIENTSYLIMVTVSLLAIRISLRQENHHFNYGYGKVENLADLFVVFSLFISLLAVWTCAYYRIIDPQPLGDTTAGIVLVCSYAAINLAFLARFIYLYKKEESGVILSQIRLTKVAIIGNMVMLTSLLISTFCADYEWSLYADPVGTLVLSLFIIRQIYAVLTHAVDDLMDKTIDESVRLIVYRWLIQNRVLFKRIGDIKARNSGNKIIIDLFLVFPENIEYETMLTNGQSIMKDIKKDISYCTIHIVPISNSSLA